MTNSNDDSDADENELRKLYELVYEELHRLSRAKLRHEPDRHLHPTSLVLEAYAELDVTYASLMFD